MKAVDEFYRHPQTADGRLNKCKECKKSYQREYSASPQGRAADKRKYERHKDEILARNAAYREQHKESLAEYHRQWHAENKESRSAAHRAWYERNHEAVRLRVAEYAQSGRGKEAKARYERNNPEKVRARKAVRSAIQKGKLERQPCEECGEPDAQAHHEDYSKPFDIRWLCFKHHREEHGQTVVKEEALAYA